MSLKREILMQGGNPELLSRFCRSNLPAHAASGPRSISVRNGSQFWWTNRRESAAVAEIRYPQKIKECILIKEEVSDGFERKQD
jgi:hypothetical protein